jgi:hypothetical protein
MKSFRFPLEKVLEWRRTQLEMEEAEYRRRLAVVAELDRRRAEVEASRESAERQIRCWNPVAGGELDALGGFRLHVKRQEAELAATRSEGQKHAERQRTLMLEARRRVLLLERFEERRLQEWREARDRELEELASESYLAKWRRL